MTDEKFVPTIPQLDFSDGTEMLEEFAAESLDHLSGAEESIMLLEKDLSNMEAVGAIFRSFHTIKGLASFLDLEDIRLLAHISETMLDMVRKGDLSFEEHIADIIFKSIDGIRKLMDLLNEQIGNKGVLQSAYYDIGPQLQILRSIISGKNISKNKKPLGEILLNEGAVTDDELTEALDLQTNIMPHKRIGEILKEKHSASSKDINQAVNVQKGKVEASIKIRVDKLDMLIDLVGELVISETQVVHNSDIQNINSRRLSKDLMELDRITRILQESAMGMRLVPVRATFQKMLRIIRDVSKKSCKDIEVFLSGEETEIDKNMVEMISDPLVHMVRNSVDHGIELKESRVAKGKPPVGRVELAAFHRGGNVVVEIRDDGGGMDPDKLLAKAKEKGIVKEGEVLTERRIYNLVFEPGFSTAEQVTDISGRGVGMDVVKRNIEQLRGKVEIDSKLDKGSTFSIQLPITLAIIEGIVLIVGEERYILPISVILEFVQPVEKNLTNIAGRGEVYRVKGGVYPVVRLDQCFNTKSQNKSINEYTICVIETEFGRACLLVDELLGQQQVVIKSLGEKLRRVKGIAGGAILGDGMVGLILDVSGVMELAKK